MSDADIDYLDRLSVDFNLSPVGYTHKSWFADMPAPEVCSVLVDKGIGLSGVSTCILDARDLSTRFFDGFAQSRARLALLDPEALGKLCLYVGVALRAEEFRTLLDRNKLDVIKRTIGNGPLDFAISRVPFLGAMPEFSFEPEPDIGLRLRLTAIGLAYSVCPMAFAQRSYRDRLALKFPQALSATWGDTAMSDAAPIDVGVLPGVTYKVMKEFVPQWLPLFD